VYLVDLPGFGYARGGEAAAKDLAGVSEAYFAASRAPVFLLVDSRHPGLDSDVAAARWLSNQGCHAGVVATKIDKLTRAERARNLKTLETTFGMAATPVSALDGEGLDDLWTKIAKLARNR